MAGGGGGSAISCRVNRKGLPCIRWLFKLRPEMMEWPMMPPGQTLHMYFYTSLKSRTNKEISCETSGKWNLQIIRLIQFFEPALNLSAMILKPCLLLLLLSRFSRVWLCATPEMAAHQAPPSLGFSRQEHWRGLPFPSPMHESEKWKWNCSVVSDPQQLHGLQPKGSSAHGIFQARVLEWGAIAFSWNPV